MSQARHWLMLATVVATLGACGQRGALYLPGTPDPAEAPVEAATDAPAEEEEAREEEQR